MRGLILAKTLIGLLIGFNMFHYEKSGSKYQMMCDRELIAEMDEVAVAYDLQTFTMHKHGCPELVTAWVETARQAFVTADMFEMAEDLAMIVSDDWDLEDLNRIVNNTGFLKSFVEKTRD